MKFYSDPELEVVSFDIADITNSDDEWGDNEISSNQLFGNVQYDW